MIWAEIQRWDVPAFHVRVCEFLESFEETALLMMPRGHGKSTVLGVYNAWRYYVDPKYRILHQGDQDDTAYKMSRDVLAILERHPLTRKIKKESGEVQMWWVKGAIDPRNPSMQARGITSNVTSSRADEIQNDDVEVPRNIQSADAREKLRYRLTEQTHILVPGGKRLYVGTPHTHHSLYDEVKKAGAECMILRMFENHHRAESTDCISVKFRPEYVFVAIGAGGKLLEAGEHYTMTEMKSGEWQIMLLDKAVVVDVYSGCLWPERFTRSELSRRRRECRTLNEWDSQYMLMARPVGSVRLDPEKIEIYDHCIEYEEVNNSARMTLGGVQIVGLSVVVDPSSGKLNSDVSALALVLQDGNGKRYWHRALPLTGEVAEFGDDGKTITGGQVIDICDVVKQFHVGRVSVETNGIGAFMPAVLKAALKQRGLVCGVGEDHNAGNKNKRILEAFEPLILSSMIAMSRQVADSPAYNQMLEFNPSTTSNEDDYIDAAAQAIIKTPERIQSISSFQIKNSSMANNWQPMSGTFEVQVDY